MMTDKEYMSNRQKERAVKAKKFSLLWDSKIIIRMSLVQDNQVTIEDIDLAQKLFGPDVGPIKGKTTRKKIQAQEKSNITIS